MREDFYSAVSNCLADLLPFQPTLATQVGEHRFDDRLADFSSGSGEKFISQIKKWLRVFQEASLADREAEVDRRLMVAILKKWLIDGEELDLPRRNPALYADEVTTGPYLLLIRDFSPTEERALCLRDRLKQIPEVLRQGKVQLRNPPRIWTENAILTLSGSSSLFSRLLAQLGEKVPEMHKDLEQAANMALRAIEDFSCFLKQDLLPHSNGDFSTGREIWEEIAREVLLLEEGAEEVLAYGEELLKHTEKEMERLASRLEPNISPEEVLSRLRDHHPEAEELLRAYRRTMESAKQFLFEHDLVSFPPGEELEVQETPETQRPIFPYAAYFPPAPLETKQKGIFYVTPVDLKLGPEERARRLRAHSWIKIPIIAVHEAYPGHHLQLVWSNRAPTLIRRLGVLISVLFIEGWAFYCEEMMEEQGFLKETEVRLGRLAEQRWRAYRILIDVGLHTRKMSAEEAVRMLVAGAKLEEEDAWGEVRRYAETPAYPMSYMIGKRELLKLVEEYRKKMGKNFRLKEFHDRILRLGSLPPTLARSLLLNE